MSDAALCTPFEKINQPKNRRDRWVVCVYSMFYIRTVNWWARLLYIHAHIHKNAVHKTLRSHKDLVSNVLNICLFLPTLQRGLMMIINRRLNTLGVRACVQNYFVQIKHDTDLVIIHTNTRPVANWIKRVKICFFCMVWYFGAFARWWNDFNTVSAPNTCVCAESSKNLRVMKTCSPTIENT